LRLSPPGGAGSRLSLQTESKPREVNRNLTFVALVVALVFIACSLFYVWSHHQIISLGYETSQASREEQELLQENKKLRLELAGSNLPAGSREWPRKN